MENDKKTRIFISGIIFLMLAGALIYIATNRYDLGNRDHRLLFSQNLLSCIVLHLYFTAILFRQRVARAIIDFFQEKDHALNLSIFRVLVFWIVLISFNIDKTAWFASLPRDLIIAPPGWETILTYLPINPATVINAGYFLKLFCVLAMIGFFTRFSAWMVVILSLYVYGIPQFYGKINHYHYIWWFSLIMANCRCWDFLSVDAIISKLRNRGKIDLKQIYVSNQYGLPIRFIWVLMGILYFFPGFWKGWIGGMDWAFSNNLVNRMYLKWFELDGWLPIYRLDQHYWLPRLSALWVMIFEMSFIFIIFIPKIRWLAPACGILFHFMTKMTMGIFSFSNVMFYLLFFNLQKILKKMGGMLFRAPMVIVCSEHSSEPLKMFAALKTFDLFDQLNVVAREDTISLNEQGVSVASKDEEAETPSYFVGGKQLDGLSIKLNLILRVPLLIVFGPVLIFGNVISTIRKFDSKEEVPAPRETKFSNKPLIICSVILIVGNIYCGFGRTGGIDSWPLACFPTFAGNIKYPVKSVLDVIGIDEQGQTIPIDNKELIKHFSSPRYWGLISYLLYGNDNDAKYQKRINAFLAIWARYEPNIYKAKKLQFYKSIYSTIPKHFGKDPIIKKLIMEIQAP